MQHGWGAVVFVSIGTICLVALASSAAAFAYRAIRPFKYTNPILINSSTNHQNSDTYIQAAENFKNLQHNIDYLALEKMNQLDHDISRIETHMLLIAKSLGYNTSDLISAATTSESLNHNITEKITMLSNKIKATHDDLIKTHKELNVNISVLRSDVVTLNEDHVKLKKDIMYILRAKDDLKYFDAGVEEIDRIAERLTDPLSKSEIYGQWQDWASEFDRLKSRINLNCRHAGYYGGAKSQIFGINPDLYKSQNWKFNFDGMSDDQKHDYKTFRIIMSNFEREKSAMRSVIYEAAHGSV
ncbi:hypothetical protein JCM2811A_41810 [Methylorubrum rhodinum]